MICTGGLFLCLSTSGCPANGAGSCSPISCANGCCSSDDRCLPGNTPTACGLGGIACATCPVTMTCVPGGRCGAADAGIANPDAGSGSGGAISCPSTASFNTSNYNSCGSWRWSEKTGGDLATQCPGGGCPIDFTPTATSIGALGQLPVPSGLGASTPRTGPEFNTYLLRNVAFLDTKLEADSDYHLPIQDPVTGATMEIEIPFPGTCVQIDSPFYCFITRSRGGLENVLLPTGSYQAPPAADSTISVIGVAFFDLLHGSASAAPNGIELHPVLGICFGVDCDPMSYSHP